MEEVEGRSESPSSKTITNSRLSNLSNEEVLQDSDPKESLTKKRSAKRKSRSSDKENGEVNPSTNGTNGDFHITEEKKLPQNGEATDMKEANAVTSSDVKHDESENHQNDLNEENSEETPKEKENGGGGGAEEVAEDKSINGNAQMSASTTGIPEEKISNSEEVSPKEVVNESMNIDTDESFFTAETESIPTDKAEGMEMPPKDIKNVGDNGNLDSESDREKENGFEGFSEKEFKVPIQIAEQSEKAEPSKGFFGKWSFSLMSDKKEPETNGHYSEDINTTHLYFSSIRGRMPLSRASPVVTVGENNKDSVFYRKDMKTPPFTRTLDDSFGVKSEPSRINRGESKEKPNLRKFPAKRCLNADESDDKEESFLTNLPFTKRRKLEDDKTRTGFLRSFLWSPFRKRSISDSEDASSEKLEDKTAVAEVKPSWFRSPFWFWKRCNKEERNS